MYSGPPASNKPYKVCPEVITAKDYPCVAMGPTASILARTEIPSEPNTSKEDRERVKMTISVLRALADDLEKSLEKPTR